MLLIVPCIIVGAFASIIALIHIHRRITRRRAAWIDMTGKTVLITGANSGVGFETAKALASRNARVIMACRSLAKGEKARAEIVAATKNEKVVVKQVDLSLLSSVRDFCNDIIAHENQLDVLINNAGLVDVNTSFTSEGLCFSWASNYYGHFLMNGLLLDLLKASAPSRIVIVSSWAHTFCGQLQFKDGDIDYSQKAKQYQWSKLAQIMYAKTLAALLKDTGVTVNCLHPGTINSNLFNKLDSYVRYPIQIIAPLAFMSSEEGAQTSIHCATSKDLDNVSGRYFSNCSLAQEASIADDTEVAEKLWLLSQRLTKWSPVVVGRK